MIPIIPLLVAPLVAPLVAVAPPQPHVCHATTGERYIIRHESHGDTSAQNPTSSAFGLGQLTLDNRSRAAAVTHVSPGSTRRCGQLKDLRWYVHERYGSTANAVAHEEGWGWY